MDFHVTAEQQALQQVCQRLATDFATRATQHDRESSLPLENYTALQHAGLYGLTVPKALGGGGAGFLSWTLAAEALAQGCPATALTFTMHIAAVEWVFDDPLFAPAVRQRVAALAVQHQKLIAFGLSESSSSSLLGGAANMPAAQARRVPGGYVLQGRKAFLSMLEGCDYVFLTAHPAEAPSPAACLVLLMPYPSPGQRVEEVWDTLGMRGTRSNNLVLEDCFVPDECVCGSTEDYVTWVQTSPAWAPGVSATPAYLGVGAAAYHTARTLLTQRVPRGFTQPLSYHPDIRRRVAEMSVELEAARWLMYHAAWLVDTVGKTPTTVAALLRAKYFVGEAVARVTRSALTACGAHALFKTSPLERLFRDGASAPIMPPSSDACLNGLGILELGLDRTEILPPLKVTRFDRA